MHYYKNILAVRDIFQNSGLSTTVIPAGENEESSLLSSESIRLFFKKIKENTKRNQATRGSGSSANENPITSDSPVQENSKVVTVNEKAPPPTPEEKILNLTASDSFLEDLIILIVDYQKSSEIRSDLQNFNFSSDDEIYKRIQIMINFPFFRGLRFFDEKKLVNAVYCVFLFFECGLKDSSEHKNRGYEVMSQEEPTYVNVEELKSERKKDYLSMDNFARPTPTNSEDTTSNATAKTRFSI